MGTKRENLLYKISSFIVSKRYIFFFLYAAAILFSVAAMNWVEVENDVTQYLPEDTETRQGIVAMSENFAPLATARVMVSNVTYDQARDLCGELSAIDGIDMILFDDTADHYREASALYDVNFAGDANSESALGAMTKLRQALEGYDFYIDSQVGYDPVAEIHTEMSAILVIAVVIILVVLTLTSRAYAEVPVLLITFGVAAILNMGTNFLCGKISFISDAVAVVLQLALAIDYAIILCHRFSDEHETKNARDAAVAALAKAIPEISASSLTTISGLVALAFMKFTIGLDMSVVLIKSIFLSLLSVFTLMPGLLVVFSPLIDKTRHRKLLPSVSFLGKFAVATRRVVPVLFLVVLVGAFWLSGKCPFCYSYTDVKTSKVSSNQVAYFKIKDTFGVNNMVALLVPSGDYEAEKAITDQLEAMPQVKSTLALSGIEIADGTTLTTGLTPRELSEMINMDYEVVQALYTGYAMEHDQYGAILGGLSDYKVPLFDMVLFLKDQMENYNIRPGGQMEEMMDELFAQLETAKAQMASDKYSRMVIYLNLPEESDETFDFLTTIRDVTGQYYDGDYYVVGNSTSSRDLAASFAGDNLLISSLSALLVVLVLLFTFRSVGLPILLIIVIQGAIWINFSFPALMDQPLYFLGYLIVNAIQMGANIDYAIVISSHYQELKTRMPHKQAIVEALNASFPTVFTSGTIMSSAALLIGSMSAQPVVSIMGNCLGRGTIISIILVLLVLPAVLVLGDSIIEHTRFHLGGHEKPRRTETGKVLLRGHVKGYISGMVDGEFSGLIEGKVDAAVTTADSEERGQEDE